MTRLKKVLVVAVVATLGLWGCGKGPGVHGSGNGDPKALEQKLTKLEGDFRVAAAARDQARQKLAAAEEQRNRLQKEVAQLARVLKERDDLRQQVTVSTGERDALQVQFDQFRKAIREVLGQAEAAGSSLQQPVTSATTPAVPGNS